MLPLLLLITAASLILAVWSFSVALMDRGSTADRLDAINERLDGMTQRLDSVNNRLDLQSACMGEVRADIRRRAKRREREAAAATTTIVCSGIASGDIDEAAAAGMRAIQNGGA